MTEQTATKMGRFVWHDMMSTDLEKSIEFYTALFGWTVEEMPVGDETSYSLIKAGGVGIGGFVGMDEGEEIPSHWIGYVTVDDVDRTVAAARENGGKAPVEGTDIPGTGCFAVVSHDGGSYLSPFKPANLEACVPEAETIPGRFCWNQLMSRDPEAARLFYEKIFGWTTRTQELDGGTYWLYESEGTATAGMMSSAEQGDFPDFWLAYVEVEDTDATAARVTALGGQVLVPPTDIPGLARFAVTADPTGAILAVSTHKTEPI